MVRYVVLLNWTDQGVRTAKDTVHRLEQTKSSFEKVDVIFEATYWTLGSHDLVAVVTAPDDVTLTTALLRLTSEGNVRTETLRAFDPEEMRGIADNAESVDQAGEGSWEDEGGAPRRERPNVERAPLHDAAAGTS